MEKASLRLQLYVILFTTSLSVRSAVNIFTKCVQGNFDFRAGYFLEHSKFTSTDLQTSDLQSY